MTPSEIYLAQRHEAPLIKIFPANIVGHEFVQSIRELFPGQLFIPTGGVERSIRIISGHGSGQGYVRWGLGSRLITKEVLTQHNYDSLYKNTVIALDLVQSVMNEI